MAFGFHRDSGRRDMRGSGGAPPADETVTELPEVVVTARPRGRWYDPLVNARACVARAAGDVFDRRDAGDHYYALKGGGFRPGGGADSLAGLRQQQEAFASRTRSRPPVPTNRALVGTAGKLNNLPNTVVGVGYGLAGHAYGKMTGSDPRIAVRDNAIQFFNNPFGGEGAITLGNTTTYIEDPYDRTSKWWGKDGRPTPKDKNPIYLHEKAHTRQGEELGGLYLPSNVAGGVWAKVNGKTWDDRLNWNEVGPQLHPPRPWQDRE